MFLLTLRPLGECQDVNIMTSPVESNDVTGKMVKDLESDESTG